MPAVSASQKRFFGLIKGIQEGKSKGSAKAREVAKTMPPTSVDHFASTSEKGLPEKKASLAFTLGSIAGHVKFAAPEKKKKNSMLPLLAGLGGAAGLGGLAYANRGKLQELAQRLVRNVRGTKVDAPRDAVNRLSDTAAVKILAGKPSYEPLSR